MSGKDFIEKPTAIVLRDLFKDERRLHIPDYQRPYTWKRKHVIQLLNDIDESKNRRKKRFRIGTIIFYKTDTHHDIVDGQQRLVTITIILHFLKRSDRLPLLKLDFPDDSKKNIQNNYYAIQRWFQNFDGDEKNAFSDYIYECCEFIKIELTDISVAFQLFDSQNARGKALEPFDLLKAFHLREMEHNSLCERRRCVKKWEESVDDNGLLGNILGDYVYRIRKWSRGEKAGYFTKDDIEEFKGVSLEKFKSYPYLKPYVINDSITSRLEKDTISRCYSNSIRYPFQINQMIINGKRFFEFVDHYIELYKKLFSENNSDFFSFYKKHTQYDGSHRSGDGLVRDMFKALILLYYDKFGENDFSGIYQILYRWSYTLRLKLERIGYPSIDKYVVENEKKMNMFKLICKHYFPHQLLMIRVEDICKEGKIRFSISEVEEGFERNAN